MAYYFVANYDVKDAAGYGDYQKAAGASFAGRAFKVLAMDPKNAHLEGASAGHQTVILEFESKAAFDDWYNSPAYQEAIQKRFAATAPAVGLGVQGLG